MAVKQAQDAGIFTVTFESRTMLEKRGSDIAAQCGLHPSIVVPLCFHQRLVTARSETMTAVGQ